MNTLSLPPYTCRCGGVVTGIELCSNVEIGPGYNVICGECLFVSVFADDMSLRPAAHHDLTIAFARHSFVNMMLRFQRARGWRVIG